MPRHKSNLSYALVENEKRLIIEWPPIERACKFPLSEDMRKEIEAATRGYLLSAQGEQTAVPLSDVEDLLRNLKRTAKQFHMALRATSAHRETAAYLESIMGKTFYMLIEAVTALVDACNLVEPQPGHIEGIAWGEWIRKVTDIMRRCGLPTEAGRKGSARFTAFVWAIQRQLPDGYAKHMHSREALGQAINRAR